MRTRYVLLPVAVVFAAIFGGVLYARTAGNVVATSYAGETRVAVDLPAPTDIVQRHPFSDTVTTARSGDQFKDRLKVVGSQATVQFTVTSPNPSLNVSGDGTVTTVGGPLGVGSYTVSGTDQNADNETGTWSFTLNVTT